MSTWKKIGYDILSSGDGVLSVDWSSGDDYKHLRVICWIKDHANGNAISFRFNDDTGSNYGSRRSSDDWEATSGTTFINTSMDSYTADNRVEMNIVNPVGNYHKLCVGSVASHKGGDTNGTEFYGRWQGNEQITKITCNLEGTVDLEQYSFMTVWGVDDDATGTAVYPNIPNGTIFEETDTRIYYMWDGTDTWNRVATT